LILADASVWIDRTRAYDTPQVRRLAELLAAGELAVGDLTITEVLQGFQRQADYDRVRALLLSLPIMEIVGREVAVRAAEHHRFLRSKGVTVRKTIDTLIATRCILDGHALLFSDRDFQPFVEWLGLRDGMDHPPVG